jgi:hypothetical protein
VRKTRLCSTVSVISMTNVSSSLSSSASPLLGYCVYLEAAPLPNTLRRCWEGTGPAGTNYTNGSSVIGEADQGGDLALSRWRVEGAFRAILH